MKIRKLKKHARNPNEIRYGVSPWGRKSDMLFKRLWRKAYAKTKKGPQITVAEIKIRSIQEKQTWLGD